MFVPPPATLLERRPVIKAEEMETAMFEQGAEVLTGRPAESLRFGDDDRRTEHDFTPNALRGGQV